MAYLSIALAALVRGFGLSVFPDAYFPVMFVAGGRVKGGVYNCDDSTWLRGDLFSDNGRYLLVQQFLGVDDSRIHLLDLRDRTTRLVAGNPEYPSGNRALTFDRRGRW